jgi:hypothetical protein
MHKGLASHGHIVAAIEHTQDAAGVEFPDETLVLGLPLDGDALNLGTRTKHTVFIINGSNSLVSYAKFQA